MPNIYVNTRTVLFPGGVAIPDVSISLYLLNGTFVTTAVTNVNGLAFLGNRAVATYEIRVTATGIVLAGNTQNIVVTGSVDIAFDVLIDTTAPSSPTDTHMCRCYGTFLDMFGRPAQNISFQFKEYGLPNLFWYSSGNTTKAVIPSTINIHTDSTGYAIVDLIRGAQYDVLLTGYENISRVISVPNLPTSSLPDVIFPFVDRLEYTYGSVLTPTNAPTLAMTVLQVKTLVLNTIFRSGQSIAGLQDISIVSSNPAVLQAVVIANTLVLTALTTGTATVQVTRQDAQEKEETGIQISPTPTVHGNLGVTIT